MIPLYVVIPVQILAVIWKSLVILIVSLPWWLILATIAWIDWVVDWIFLFTFGLFCVPCAGVFIWIINILLLPFTIWGWIFRILLDTFGLFVDGWMLPFGGSGCYIIWGHQCWFEGPSDLRKVLDIPLFNTLPIPGSGVDNIADTFMRLITPPTLNKASDILHVRRQNRKNLLAAIPILGELTVLIDQVY